MRKATVKSTTSAAPRMSRRAIMAGIAATAALPAAAANALANLAGTPDPVYAFIASAMESREAFIAAIGAVPDSIEDPQHGAADALASQRCSEAWEAFDSFAACTPTTPEGVSAALKCFAALTNERDFCNDETLQAFLGNAAMALDRIEAGRAS